MAYTASSLRYRPYRSNRVGIFKMLTAWRTRQQLKALDDRALADVGLSRAEARFEADRPFWDVPATWRD